MLKSRGESFDFMNIPSFSHLITFWMCKFVWFHRVAFFFSLLFSSAYNIMLSFGCSHSTAAAATSRCFIIGLTKCNIISCFFFCFPFFLLIEGFGEELTTTTRGEIFDNFNFSENIVKRRISLFPPIFQFSRWWANFWSSVIGPFFCSMAKQLKFFHIFGLIYFHFTRKNSSIPCHEILLCVWQSEIFFFTFDHLVRLSRIVLAISNGSHSFHIFTLLKLDSHQKIHFHSYNCA